MVEMTYGRYPVERYSIGGRYLQADNGWTPDHVHMGVDLIRPCVEGDPIYWVGPPGKARTHRPGDGWGDGTFGNCIILDHRAPITWYTLLAHMSAFLVTDGQECKEGDVIGKVGHTGLVEPPTEDGAHLHWQLSTDANFPRNPAVTADPMSFVKPVPVSPVVPPPLTLEQVLAQAQAAAASSQANRDEIVSLNAALMLRWKLEGLSRDPDLARVQSAVAILRERGFNL